MRDRSSGVPVCMAKSVDRSLVGNLCSAVASKITWVSRIV